MEEIEFKNIEDIENFKVRFKCFSISDGYQATFYLYNKKNSAVHYKVDFILSGTSYNADYDSNIMGGRSVGDYIKDKYDNLEKCFYQEGVKYLKKRVAHDNLKNEKVNLMNFLF